MERITRRRFLSRSGRSIASAALASMAFPSGKGGGALGANERIKMGLVGCGGRGRMLMRGFIEQGAEVAYMCDVHQERLEKAAAEISDAQGRRPKAVKDMREILDAKDVQAAVIATPDHWHALGTILACQAGKDVYVEKPHAHNIWECRKMIEAARKYNRVVQVGTQCRSAAYVLAALDYVKSGKLGGVRLVKVYNLKSGGPFYLGESGSVPAGVDWDGWLGPARERPYHQRIFEREWSKFWDFSAGDMGDDGIHQIDLAMMLMGDPGVPKAASCSGGRLEHKGDDAEVPDVQAVTFDFDDFVMTFELTGYPRYMQKTSGTIRRNDLFPYWTQNSTRIELYGSELLMTVGRHGGGWQVMTSGGKVVDQMYGRPGDIEHEKNFLECIKSRKRPTADVETIHSACVMVHTGNIAYRIGNKKVWFDSKAERFIDNEQANALIKRKYREKYQVPENV